MTAAAAAWGAGCPLSGGAAWDPQQQPLQVEIGMEAAQVAADAWVGVDCQVRCRGLPVPCDTRLEVLWPQAHADGADRAWAPVDADADGSARCQAGAAAGTHRLQLTQVGPAQVRCRAGSAASEGRPLQVQPGRPSQCLIVVDRSQAAAGEWVGAACAVRDAMDNAIAATGSNAAQLQVQPPVQQLDGGLVATVAGPHVLVCQCGELTSSAASLQVLAGPPQAWAQPPPAGERLGAAPAAPDRALALHDRYGNLARAQGWLAAPSPATAAAAPPRHLDDLAAVAALEDGIWRLTPLWASGPQLAERTWLKGPGGTTLGLGEVEAGRDWQALGEDRHLRLWVHDPAGLRRLQVAAGEGAAAAPLADVALAGQQDGRSLGQLPLADVGEHAGLMVWTWEATNHRGTQRRGAQAWLLAHHFAAPQGWQRRQAAVVNLVAHPAEAALAPGMRAVPSPGPAWPALGLAVAPGPEPGEQALTVLTTQASGRRAAAAAPPPGPAQQAQQGWGRRPTTTGAHLRLHDDLLNELWWVLWQQSDEAALAVQAGSTPPATAADDSADAPPGDSADPWQASWLTAPTLRAVATPHRAEVGAKLRLCPGAGEGDCVLAAARLPVALITDAHGRLQLQPHGHCLWTPLLDWASAQSEPPGAAQAALLARHGSALQRQWLAALNAALALLPVVGLPDQPPLQRDSWGHDSTLSLPDRL